MRVSEPISLEKFRILVDVTVHFTKLRLQECPHLCVENYAPELLEKLLRAARNGESDEQLRL